MFKLHQVLRPFASLLLLSCSLVSAAGQRPERRIHERITVSDLVPLPGSHSPLVERGQDLGALSPDKVIYGVTLVFKRSATQQADLDSLLTAQQDPRSPLFHHWLTPDAFAARFGMAEADLATTRTWLTTQGFTLDNVPPSQDRITFTGTVAQVQAALGTSLHAFLLEGEHHFGPSSDLRLPAALSPVVASVLHLSDLRPRPNSRPLPAFTDSSTGAHYLTPTDLAVMYDLHASRSDGLTGSGQSIAIVGESYVDLSLFGLNTFQSQLGYFLNASLVLVPGSGIEATAPGDLAESQIDLEYAGATAPDARLYLVFVGDNPGMNVFDALTFAIQQNIAPVISISYGTCEALVSSSEATSADAVFQQASAQGQTLVAAAGDSGSTDCSRFTSPSLTASQKQALTVSFPASSPHVTAVGGTQMAPNTFAPGANQFWSATSTTQNSSVLSYVPEVVWNEGSAAKGILAGGGGASALFGRPAWQSAFASMPAGNARLLPDIALQASTASPGFLLCTNDILYVGHGGGDSCSNYDLKISGRYILGGGTSFAAPVFAGSLALLNQFEQEQGQGALNPLLYQVAANPSTYAAAFHDITSGSNGCVTGASNCTSVGQASFAAGVGFDEATGLGTVDFAQLRAAWPANTAKNTALQTPFLKCDVTGVSVPVPSPGSPVQAFCNLQSYTAASAIPATGRVLAFLDQAPLGDGSAVPLGPGVAGDFTLSFTAPATPGSHLLRITYPGDAHYLPITAVFPFTVGSVQASGTFVLSASNLTLASNAAGVAAVTISPAATNGYHGELYWNIMATQTSGTNSPDLCYSISPVRVNGLTSAKLSLGAGTACGSPLPSATMAARRLSGSPRAALHPSTPERSLPLYAALLGVGFLGIRNRRRLAGWSRLACLALFMALFLVSGCGGGPGSGSGTSASSGGASGSTGSGGSGGSGTAASQPAIFTLTLYGNDSVAQSLSANTTLTLTVN